MRAVRELEPDCATMPTWKASKDGAKAFRRVCVVYCVSPLRSRNIGADVEPGRDLMEKVQVNIIYGKDEDSS